MPPSNQAHSRECRIVQILNFSANKKSRIYGTSDWSVSYKLLKRESPISPLLPLSPLLPGRYDWTDWTLSHTASLATPITPLLRKRSKRGSEITWLHSLLRTWTLSQNQTLSLQATVTPLPGERGERGNEISETGPEQKRCDRPLLQRSDSLAHVCKRGRVPEKLCAREAVLSDWLRQITWVSGRGCLQESPICVGEADFWTLSLKYWFLIGWARESVCKRARFSTISMKFGRFSNFW